MNTSLIMLFLSGLSALLIGWDYFGRYQLPCPPIGGYNLRNVIVVLVGILLVPYLYRALPTWLVAGLLGLSALTLLATYFQPILEDRVATWAVTLLLGGAVVAAFVYSGAGNGLYLALNNSVQLIAAVMIANLSVQRGLTGREAAILAGALLVYDVLFTPGLALMERLFDPLATLPFAPLVAWTTADRQWVGLGLGDLIMATILPLVLRKEVGRMAGGIALVFTGLALAGVLLPPALALWQSTLPVMAVLAPLLIGQVAFWEWRQQLSRKRSRQVEKHTASLQQIGHLPLVPYR